MTSRFVVGVSVVAAMLVMGGSGMLAEQARPAAAAAKYDGVWEGTYDGAGSGKFTMTLKTTGDTPTGSLTAAPAEGGGYDVTFKTLKVASDTFEASYEAPDSGALVTVSGTLSGDTLKGTYTAGPDVSGTWTATRQPAKQ